jgi:hypothetical protein
MAYRSNGYPSPRAAPRPWRQARPPRIRGDLAEGEVTPRRLTAGQRDRLRRDARRIYFAAHPRDAARGVEVHHRVPLEWSHLFGGADPHRLSNLQGLTTRDHLRKATDLWTSFRNTYQRRRRSPTAAEVLRFAALVDRSLDLPYPL